MTATRLGELAVLGLRALAPPLAVALLSALALAFLNPSDSPGDANRSTAYGSLHLIDNGEGDGNWNYDFGGMSVDAGAVDWADSMFFYNNASAIRTAGHIGWAIPGSSMWGYQTDGFGWEWADSGGVKDGVSNCLGEARHIRLYGGLDGYMFNNRFGYYHWATVHKDWNETCGHLDDNWWSGQSENVEDQLVGELRAKGLFVTPDWANLGNPRSGWESNHHFWQNDGNATYVNIPESA